MPGPGGDVHALLVRPAGPAPYATAFLVHGGPESADDDSYRARRAAYVDAGYAVVHVNYRGSTGYGSAWRDALTGRPGLTELEDVGAVYDALVAEGVVDPQRALLSGGSWGGFLTLLGLGTQPERWAAGHRRGAGRGLPGRVRGRDGGPAGLRPGAVRRLTGGGARRLRAVLADHLRRRRRRAGARRRRRQRPALPDPADRQLPRPSWTKLGKEHEVYRFDAGHGSLVIEETIRQVEVALAFALRHVRPDRLSAASAVARRAAALASIGARRISSAIWTVFSAAPLRRLSLLTNSASPRPSSTPGSWRIRPT